MARITNDGNDIDFSSALNEVVQTGADETPADDSLPPPLRKRSRDYKTLSKLMHAWKRAVTAERSRDAAVDALNDIARHVKKTPGTSRGLDAVAKARRRGKRNRRGGKSCPGEVTDATRQAHVAVASLSSISEMCSCTKKKYIGICVLSRLSSCGLSFCFCLSSFASVR